MYKKGKDNGAANALSRVQSHNISCMALSSVSHILYQQILQTYANDEGIQKILREIQGDPTSHKNLLMSKVI